MDVSQTPSEIRHDWTLFEIEAIYSSRTLKQVETWHKDGKDAAFLDLDRPETFREALTGVDRLFLATGYTVAMVHQSKTIVDAAADGLVTVAAVGAAVRPGGRA